MSYPFPVASHSYFRINNLSDARADYLKNTASFPSFIYSHITEDVIVDRLRQVDLGSSAALSLELVLMSIRLRLNPTSTNLARFRDANVAAFGQPKLEYLDGILSEMLAVSSKKTSEHLGFLQQHLPSSLFTEQPYRPNQQVFVMMKEYWDRYADIDTINSDKPLGVLLEEALSSTGLARKGWKLHVTDDHRHVTTQHGTKSIVFGKDFTPRSENAKLQIVAHEVFGHAMRGRQDSIVESEGIATMLEQLVSQRYTTKRSYRYLAAALGWGVTGKPMNFTEVYEIIWRVMVVRGRYVTKIAKVHAFDECSRVFRGGVASMAGAVYLKDSLYYSSNIAVWKKIEKSPPSYDEFVDIIEGRRKVI